MWNNSFYDLTLELHCAICMPIDKATDVGCFTVWGVWHRRGLDVGVAYN